MLILRF